MRGTGGTQLDCGYKDYRLFGGGTLVAGGGELASAVAAAGWWVLVRTAVEIQCFPPIRDETANGWGTRLFRRNEKPPLIYCMAFSSETSGAGVISAWKWSGIITNACRRNLPWLR